MSPIGYGMSKRPLPQCIKFIRAKDHCHSALSSYEQNHFATDDCLESASMPELAIQAGGQWPTLMLLASCMHAFKQSLNSFGLKPAVLLERQSTPLDWQDHLSSTLDSINSLSEQCRDLIALIFNLAAHQTNQSMQALVRKPL
eukprot:231022-Pelagomonas_calceolata.AAC.1